MNRFLSYIFVFLIYSFGYSEESKPTRMPELSAEISQRATKAFGRSDWKEARKAYTELLNESPNNALLHINLASVEQRDRNLDLALGHLDKAIQIDSTLAQAWILQGLIHYENEDYNLAISSLARAIHEDPFDARARNYMGVVIRKIGWSIGAEEEFRRAIKINPNYADAHFNLALAYLEKKPVSKQLVKRHYNKAISLGAPKDNLFEKKLNKL